MQNYLADNNNKNRGDEKAPQKKSFNFKLYKKNTIKSLNEIEHFLNNFNNLFDYIKIYKILK